MSGGSANYLYGTIANELGIPSGSYGIGTGRYGSYKEDIKESRKSNPMHDAELSEMMYDVSCLLHSLEWYDSGDTGDDTYFKDVKAFKEKWFMRNSEQTVIAYLEDVVDSINENIRRIECAMPTN